MDVFVSFIHLAGIGIIIFDFNRRLKKLEEKVKVEKPDNVSKYRGADGLFIGGRRKKE